MDPSHVDAATSEQVVLGAVRRQAEQSSEQCSFMASASVSAYFSLRDELCLVSVKSFTLLLVMVFYHCNRKAKHNFSVPSCRLDLPE